MTATAEPDGLAEFAVELKLLAEAVLERVEPVLRRAAAEGRPEWDNCSWCPVCAAAALVRGEQHDVLAAIADHGTAIVTVLREALAGVPVDPVMPDGTEPGVRHRHPGARAEDAPRQADSDPAADTDPRTAEPDSETGAGSDEPPADPATGADSPRSERGRLRRSRTEGRRRGPRANTPADAVRDDIRSGGTPSSTAAHGALAAPEAGETGRSGGAGGPDAQAPRAGARPGAPDPDPASDAAQPRSRSRTPESPEGTRTRSRYVGIPVTIKT